MLISSFVLAYDISTYTPKTGRLLKEDSTVINEADFLEASAAAVGADMEVLQFTADLTSPLDYTTSIGQDFIVHQMTFNFNGTITETLTIDVVDDNTLYNARVENTNLSAIQYWNWEEVDGKLYVYSADEEDAELNISISSATAATTQAAFTILYSLR